MMRDLQREFGLTYLFISHDLGVVRYLSNKIGVMYLGKLVEVGPADEVYLTPAHPYTKGLLDSAPVADPVAEKAKVRAGITGELPSAIKPPSGCRFRTRCPLAEEICAEVEPPLRPFSENGHLAACHFPAAIPAGRGESGVPDRDLGTVAAAAHPRGGLNAAVRLLCAFPARCRCSCGRDVCPRAARAQGPSWRAG